MEYFQGFLQMPFNMQNDLLLPGLTIQASAKAGDRRNQGKLLFCWGGVRRARRILRISAA